MRVAIDAVTRAGDHAQRVFGRRHRIMVKADSTPVTAVDRACEEIARRVISRAFPADGFLGEEFGLTRAGSGTRWILDPIDGTKSYIRGIPYWGTLLARETAGKLDLGVMYLPVMGKLLWATRGGGAFMNKRRLRTSPRLSLRGALVLSGDFDLFVKHRALKRLAAVARRGTIVRGGGDCVAYMWLAGGHADAVVEPVVGPWDVAAPRIIVEEAGGVFTDWNGRNSHMIETVLAATGRLHKPLLSLLRPHKRG